MKFTNKYGIPQEVVDAINNDRYSHKGNISVTTLLLPPRIRVLRKRYWDQIEEDVCDRLFALYGQVIHGVLERTNDFDAFHEERLYIDVDGWTVTGQTDLYKRKDNGEYVLRDYKFTSVFTSGKDKPEWQAQVNIYAHLWRKHGFRVDRAQIVLIFRDWRKREAERNPSYPPPIELIDVPLWSDRDVAQFVLERVRLHRDAETLPDDALPLCSPEERWERGASYAVMKPNRKTAVRLFESEAEAHQYIKNAVAMGEKDAASLYVEQREPEPVRCLYFCNVSQFCNFAKMSKEGGKQ